jgi:hypothetical protein
VLPSGEAHELLPKTCGVCHKDKAYQFFVVAAPTQEDLAKVLDVLKGVGVPQAAALEKPKNVHAKTACLFCHLEQPAPDADPAAMTFRTLDGTPAPLGQVQRLCEMCHAADKTHHVTVLGKGDAAADLARASLPVPDGKILCSTCHDMHQEEVGPANTRLAFRTFATKSALLDPHGNRAGCDACHLPSMKEGGPAVFGESDADLRCTRCHKEDHGSIHPVDVKPSEHTFPMQFLTYPMGDDGKVTCSTCHDHVCKGKADPRNPRFLRGGPYNVFTDFCFRCHPKGGEEGINPHEQIDERGNIVTAVCSLCHRTVPKDPEGEDFEPKQLLYLHSPVELCMGCHDQGPHPFVNHLVEMGPDKLKKLHDYEARHKVSLPLDGENRVVCTTCHNPHEKGVLRGTASLGAGELHRWRIPSFGELCTPCHERMN